MYKKYKRLVYTPQIRLRAVLHFSSGIVERAKRERAWKSPHARKGDTRQGERKMRDYRQSPSFWPFTADWFWSVKFVSPSKSIKIPSLIELSPRRVSPFLAWGDFHARSRFARSTIPGEKWGTTRSLPPDLLATFCKANLSNGKNSAGFAFQVFVFQA